MVQAGTDEVELRLVVDRATIEQQLSGGFDVSKAKGPSGGGAMGKGAKGGTKVSPGPKFMQIFKPMAALDIIKFGINTMVKNSKVLSTTMGAFGAIMGAILDIILIAFMPVIVKILKWLVDQLPAIQKWVERAATWVTAKVKELLAWWEINGADIKEALSGIWESIKIVSGWSLDALVVGWNAFKLNMSTTVELLRLIYGAIDWVAKKFGYSGKDVLKTLATYATPLGAVKTISKAQNMITGGNGEKAAAPKDANSDESVSLLRKIAAFMSPAALMATEITINMDKNGDVTDVKSSSDKTEVHKQTSGGG